MILSVIKAACLFPAGTFTFGATNNNPFGQGQTTPAKQIGSAFGQSDQTPKNQTGAVFQFGQSTNNNSSAAKGLNFSSTPGQGQTPTGFNFGKPSSILLRLLLFIIIVF